VTARPTACDAADPFDLPEWLGVDDVVWAASDAMHHGIVPGVLRSEGADGATAEEIVCDLLAADRAVPVPAVDEQTRFAVHQAWRHGQIHLVRRRDRLTLAAPGTDLDADRVLEMIARLAKAVGAPADRFSVLLRVGRDRHGMGARD
jgi:hypothetical protein